MDNGANTGRNDVLLTGKTAVISGAASKRGIGLCTARLFAEHGAISGLPAT